MQIALGSENPVKKRALLRALRRLEVSAEPVFRRVPMAPRQPRTEAETEEGAAYRAWYARRTTGAAVGVGLEGGVDLASGWLTMYAAATDGERLFLGRGPSVPLPEPALEAVRRGQELGAFVRQTYGEEAAEKGAVWVFSKGALTREEALALALVLALAPLLR